MNCIESLEIKDYNQLLQIPKSDIHSHAGRGGNIKFISERTGSNILPPPEKYDSLSHMQQWFDENIKPICGNIDSAGVGKCAVARVETINRA